MKVDARESARRLHRKIALFCVIYSWLSNADGVYLSRSMLNRFTGLERMKKVHIQWIREDFYEYFPNVEELYEDNAEKILAGIKFTRHNIEHSRDVKKLELDFGYILGLENFFKDGAFSDHNRDEIYVSCIFALLSQGQIAPKGIFAGEAKNL